jgi:hypothetical protein
MASKREICSNCGRRSASRESFLCQLCTVVLAKWFMDAAAEVTRG